MDETKVWRLAQIAFQAYGQEAARWARQRRAERYAAGDLPTAWVLAQVVQALSELARVERRPDEALQ